MSHRQLLLAGAAGPVLFTAVWLVEGATRPGYHPMRNWVSELSLSDRGWIQVASFLTTGALIVVLGRGLRAAMTDGPGATWGPRLVTLTGVGLIAGGLFVIDPSFYQPAGTPAGPTWHGTLHDIAAAVVYASMVSATVVYSRRFARRYSLATAGLTVAFWIAAGVLNGLDHAGTWSPAPAGLFQRLSLVVPFAYLIFLAYRALTSTPRVLAAAMAG